MFDSNRRVSRGDVDKPQLVDSLFGTYAFDSISYRLVQAQVLHVHVTGQVWEGADCFWHLGSFVNSEKLNWERFRKVYGGSDEPMYSFSRAA